MPESIADEPKRKVTVNLEKNGRHILCMYSGGLDSLGALYTLLESDEYDQHVIHVHHMHLINIENRAKAEALAVASSIKQLKRMYPNRLFLTESSHDYRFMRRNFMFDTEMVAFMVSNIVRGDRRIEAVAVGRTASDISTQDAHLDDRLRRLNRAQAIYKVVLSDADRKPAPYVFPVLEMTKQDVFNSLPEEMMSLFWSCRHPTYTEDDKPLACKKCGTCLELEEIHHSTKLN